MGVSREGNTPHKHKGYTMNTSTTHTWDFDRFELSLTTAQALAVSVPGQDATDAIMLIMDD